MNLNCRNLIVFKRTAAKPNIIQNPTIKKDEIEIIPGYGYGWSVSNHNPEDIVYSFSQLKIKEAFKLSGYQYEDGNGNGNGIVWAIPADRRLPDPHQCEIIDDKFLEPPKPDFAEDDFMIAIEGDKSPLSYLQAAIVLHELNEFGAIWHGCSWSEEDILPHTDDYEEEMLEKMPEMDDDFYEGYRISNEQYLNYLHYGMEFKEIPEIFHPHFFYKNDQPTVVFYALNEIGYYKLNRYTHTFDKSSYIQMVSVEEIGTGGPGIIF